ncbi:MAG: dTDP-4-amino-4,6-dideoxygalactose transaminase [Candidatus Riflebacteria bacterium]|nr:dTDP-4-amino-4,6-dideoxygalactose transaminase [Candidatus Riflebacteria bacterium]
MPFNRPSFVGNELAYISEAIAQGHVSGDGSFTRRCHRWLEERLGVPKALLTTSCTHALEMAALLLDLGEGDEVIVPSFTFVSTANAFAMRGATPVFCDVRPDTLNIDESRIESLITDKTRAVVVVHYAGVACEMDAIAAIAASRGLKVIEDNAHGLFGRYKGIPLGTIGCMATQSFHETKNVTCGEGGALLLNDPRYVDRAEILREKGTKRSQFFRGQVDKYTWVDLGSSYLPSDILAAFLLAQLERAEEIQRKRRLVWDFYHGGLVDWASRSGSRLPIVPEHCEQAYHMFYVLLPTARAREALTEHLERLGIMAVFHYRPLHLAKMGVRYGARPGDCPVAEEVCDRLLRLPLYYGIGDGDVARTIQAVSTFMP